MDYKYIECLVERYFNCETTLEEERILRDFFRQEEVPPQLAQYKPLFSVIEDESALEVSDAFDQKLALRLQSIQHKQSNTLLTFHHTPSEQGSDTKRENSKRRKVRFVRFNRSLTPFYKAVASVALIITVGVTSSRYWNSKDAEPVNYNYASYHDTYKDPQVACEQVTDALKDLSDALKGSGLMPSDTVSQSASQQSVSIQEGQTTTDTTAE